MMKPLSLALGCLVLLAAAATAQKGDEKGRAFAYEADERDKGYEDFTAVLLMTLRNRHGQESQRELRTKTLEQHGDGDKSLVIFARPADIKGTALLTFAHLDGTDDQWLYLPALKRVKRIASSNQSGSFMGSEFSYEDFSSNEVEKFDYKFLREETLDGHPCTVLEQYPKHPKSGYTRQVAWYSNEYFRILKIDYYDRKNDLLKTLTATDFTLYEDKHWRPRSMYMLNHQNGKSTTLVWDSYAFKTGLTDRDFDKSALERVR